MNKKKFILTLVISSVICFVTAIITTNILRSNENDALYKEKKELARLDSLIVQREYYQKQLDSILMGYTKNEIGNAAKATYLGKIITEIDEKIKKIVPDTTVNLPDTAQNIQTDSIKYLNETILEIKKELDELKQQKPKLPKPAATSTNNVSKIKPDTTKVQQPQKEVAADSANNAKPDTSAIKPKPETEKDTIE